MPEAKSILLFMLATLNFGLNFSVGASPPESSCAAPQPPHRCSTWGDHRRATHCCEAYDLCAVRAPAIIFVPIIRARVVYQPVSRSLRRQGDSRDFWIQAINRFWL